MTPRRQPSEKEKLYLFAFLFPPLWPLGIAMLIGDIVEAARDSIVSRYRAWRERRGND